MSRALPEWANARRADRYFARGRHWEYLCYMAEVPSPLRSSITAEGVERFVNRYRYLKIALN